MKLFLIGGTGNVGREILAEALSRGHQVTALTRDPAKLAGKAGVAPVKGDIQDSATLATQIAGHDAVIVSYNPGWMDPEAREKTVSGAESVMAAARKAGVKRLFFVGGASSLETAPGVQLFDRIGANMPPTVKGAVIGAREVLYALRKVDDLDWSFFSPAETIKEGPRTGKFRLGGDQLVVGADGVSWISRADFAIAVIDDIEKPQHIKKRFTIGY
jgi:putative NADH-flavin reductase